MERKRVVFEYTIKIKEIQLTSTAALDVHMWVRTIECQYSNFTNPKHPNSLINRYLAPIY